MACAWAHYFFIASARHVHTSMCLRLAQKRSDGQQSSNAARNVLRARPPAALTAANATQKQGDDYHQSAPQAAFGWAVGDDRKRS